MVVINAHSIYKFKKAFADVFALDSTVEYVTCARKHSYLLVVRYLSIEW